MKIEKISGNKLKVTLTPDDMQKWGIDIDALAHNPVGIDDWLHALLETAESKTHLDLDNARLMIEAMPGNNDEIIFFVTKIGTELPAKRGRYRVKQSKSEKPDDELLYEFDSFDDLCELAKRFWDCSLQCVLYSYNTKYYLHILSCNSLDFKTSLSDYGMSISSPSLYSAFLKEHGKIICSDNVLENLAKYFK